MWEQAEKDVKEAADRMKLDYFIGIGEATFYGPKIDFMIKDAIGRQWQLGTVQVDYVQPERFDMTYIGSDGAKHRPVVIHRAPFGSMERFVGVLIEHFAGNFPLWLAPVQAAVLPITDNQLDYAKEIYSKLKENKFRTELDDRSEKVGYKIRDWETKKVPYMIVLGDKEKQSGTITVRAHKKGDLGVFAFEEFIKTLAEERDSKKINY